MKLIKLTSATALALTFLASSAWAQNPTATPRIDQRATNQQQRINQGVANGQLNANEAARMQARENSLNSNIAAAKADGKVTAAERAQLHHQENHNSRAIARNKHNNR